jgi:hypothetical protein
MQWSSSRVHQIKLPQLHLISFKTVSSDAAVDLNLGQNRSAVGLTFSRNKCGRIVFCIINTISCTVHNGGQLNKKRILSLYLFHNMSINSLSNAFHSSTLEDTIMAMRQFENSSFRRKWLCVFVKVPRV